MMAASVAQNLPALSESIEKVGPVAIVVELGGNDRMFGVTPEKIVEHLMAIIQKMKQIKSVEQMFIMQIFPGNEIESVVAERTGAILVAPPLELFDARMPVLNRKYVQADGIHPNESAQPLIVRGLLAALHGQGDFTCSLLSEEEVAVAVAAADHGADSSCSRCAVQ
jgi:acyl-CoA thioesterase-1